MEWKFILLGCTKPIRLLGKMNKDIFKIILIDWVSDGGGDDYVGVLMKFMKIEYPNRGVN